MSTISAGAVGVDIDPNLLQSRSKAMAQAKVLGEEAGRETGAGFNRKFDPDLVTVVRKQRTKVAKAGQETGQDAGQEFTVGFSKKLGGLGGRISTAFTGGIGQTAALAGGAALAGVFVSAFGDALDQSKSAAKLTAQLDLSGPAAAKAGKIAGDLFSNAYGDSMDDVNEAVRKVTTDIGISFDNVDFEAITGKVLSLSEAFDEDLGATTQAVGQLMKTGLAPNAAAALDIVAKGLQVGGSTGDDLLDTLKEYPTQFQKLGLDGGEALGIISQGLKAGARDSDLVADALKEFSIRAIDGSKSTAEGFDALGLSADKMSGKLAGGGDSATAALQLTLDKLRAIPDPVLRSQAAVQLFGTQAEDLGAALYAIDPSKAVAGLGNLEGAADRVNATLGATASSTFTAFKRQAEQQLVTALAAVLSGFQGTNEGATGWLGTLQNLGGALHGVTVFVHDHAEALKNVAIAVGTMYGAYKTANGILKVTEILSGSLEGALRKLGVQQATAATAATRLSTAGSSVAGVVAGPLGIALSAGTVAYSIWAGKQAEAKGRVDDLTASLNQQTGALTDQTREAVVNQLQSAGLLKQAKQYGLDLATVTDAALGNADALVKVRGGLDQYSYALLQTTGIMASANAAGDANSFFGKLQGQASDVSKAAGKWREHSEALGKDSAAAKKVAGQTAPTTNAISGLGDVAKHAGDEIDNLATTLDALLGKYQSVPAAQASYEQSIDDLTGKITTQNRQYVRQHGMLDISSEKGRTLQGNILTMIEANKNLASAIYTETGSSDKANESWNRGVKSLVKHLEKMGYSREEAIKLAQKYGAIPDIVSTQFRQPGLAAGVTQVDKLGLKIRNLDGKLVTIKVRYDGPAGILTKNYGGYGNGLGVLKAAGGPIAGPGTATSDSIPAMLSNGEHVWTTREVNAAGGHGAVEELRRLALSGGHTYATGGPVTIRGIQSGYLDIRRLQEGVAGMAAYLGKQAAAAVSMFGGGGGSPGMGYRKQMDVLHQAFPGLALISGFRPGAITATGNKSMHGAGRAVDVPPRMDVFNWIRSHYPNSKELIFSPAGARQIHNGRPHVYTGITKAMHYNHVHWGYDKGGWLKPGVTTVQNDTGKPEAVFNQQQLAELTQRGDGGTTIYQIDARSDDDRKVGRTIVRSLQRQDMYSIATSTSR